MEHFHASWDDNKGCKEGSEMVAIVYVATINKYYSFRSMYRLIDISVHHYFSQNLYVIVITFYILKQCS